MKKAWVLSYPLSACEDSDQTGQIPSAGRTLILLVLSCRSSYFLKFQEWLFDQFSLLFFSVTSTFHWTAQVPGCRSLIPFFLEQSSNSQMINCSWKSNMLIQSQASSPKPDEVIIFEPCQEKKELYGSQLVILCSKQELIKSRWLA